MTTNPERSNLLKQAYLAIEDLQKKLDAAERAQKEPVAVIGIGCRFPGGANDPASFWHLLRNGVDAVRQVPRDRWNVDLVFDSAPGVSGKTYARRAGFLDQVDLFDPQFFGISPREAVAMDPQQRLLLQVAWEALEHAGIAPDKLNGSRTGVFVGIASSDYATLQLKSNDLDRLDAYYSTGVAHSVASGRIAYVLGLQGPSLSLDTACSSSLVAVHLALQSLRAGECTLALAGGVHLILTPENTISFSQSRMLAPDGKCKTFDARADGFADGEGCGIVVLKKLSDALKQGDPILAIIRGSAINQDGASSGLTAPNGPSQEAVIREALADAGVKPNQVSYVEAHGTGTALGDPIEAQALGAVLRESRTRPFYLGAVKTNFGHLEAAAGIAGLIKVVLMLQHGGIPPHLHFETPSPLIPWATIPAVIPTKFVDWQVEPKIAGISSFGFSGTNAHLILEQAPDIADHPAQDPDRPLHVLTLAAKNASALHELATRYADKLRHDPTPSLSDLAFTANTGRAHFNQRLALITESIDQARAKLEAFAQNQTPAGLFTGELQNPDHPRVAFLFTGQGAQYIGMGKQLYDTQPVFRAVINQCTEILRPILGPKAEIINLQSEIDETTFTQPALFALEYALAELWKSWGILPNAVMGHSLGEYVAACVAGVFNLEDGLRLIAERGRMMQALTHDGMMAAVFADEARVMQAIGESAPQVSIAALNGPDNTVISGATQATQAVLARLQAQGVKVKRLAIPLSSHSPMVEPMLDAYERVLAEVKFSAQKIRIISNVTGKPASTAEMSNPAYWRKHTRHAVRFADSLETLRNLGFELFIEIGPQPVLAGMGKRCLEDYGTWLPSLRKGQDEWQTILASLAALYTKGVNVDWIGFDKPYARQKLALPTYPFQRERYWPPSQPPISDHRTQGARPIIHPLLGAQLFSPLKELQFESQVSSAALAVLNDHRVFGTAILPATAYLAAFVAAARMALRAETVALEDLMIHEALVVPDDTTRTTQVIAKPDGTMQFFSIGADETEWKLHATARARVDQAINANAAHDEIRARCSEQISAQAHYANLREHGLDFGASLRGVRKIWRRAGEAFGEIQLPDAQIAEAAAYAIHPALFDACLQILGATMLEQRDTFLPISIETLRLAKQLPPRVWSHVIIRPSHTDQRETLAADVRISDETGSVIAELEGLRLKRASRDQFANLSSRLADWLYEIEWKPKPRVLFDLEPIAAQAQSNVAALSEQHGLGAYAEFLPQVEALSAAYIAQAFAQLGLPWQRDQRFTTNALAEQLRIVAPRRRLFTRVLEILSEEKILARAGDEWRVMRVPALNDLQTQLDDLFARYPFASAKLTVLRRCAPQLANALRGQVDALQLLFPGGSFDLLEQLYQHSPFAKTYNGLVKQIVQHATDGRTARILEIGAGTGGTTAYVLPLVASTPGEYVFTDISPLFVAQAQEKFRAFPFVRYQTLDIEQDPVTQGFAAHQFDLILATNVIHATADLRNSLRHIQQLLAPNGLLVMTEVTRPQRWVDLTFGLTDGWWRFADHSVRPAYPLLTQIQWLALLSDLGFTQPTIVPRDAENDAALALQSVVIARAPCPHGQWLILADETGIGKKLAAMLQARGETCVLVQHGAAYAPTADGAWVINPAQSEDFVRVLRDAVPAGCRGVIHLWGLDANSLDRQNLGVGSALHLAQALAKITWVETPRLFFVTQNAQPAKQAPAAVFQAPIWGLAKTIVREHPELRCVCVDIDSRENLLGLGSEILMPDEEDQVAWRGNERFVARLARHKAPKGIRAPRSATRLEITSRGSLDNLALKPLTRHAPQRGQVEIQVVATGLNFRDVLNVLGMYPGDPGLPGGECAGRIVAVGEDVQAWQIGDEVIALGVGCFASFVTVSTELVVRKPARLSFAQAATLAIPFVTAYFTLHHLGQMQKGERVLIHAAAGGVGLAAIQLAQRAGAEIFATAGSEEKRAYLKSLGVPHVLNSRTLDFADEVMRLTHNQGVDLVLNSLAGEFIPKSLAVLADKGRFIEIGKSGLLDAAQAAQLGRQRKYFVVDWGEDARREPGLIRAMLKKIIADIDAGDLHPLPVREFSIDDAVSAFRYMAQAKQIGKIAVSQGADFGFQVLNIQADATYWITGGLGGLGLVFARWLVERGARHLVLMGRHAPNDVARHVLDALERRGAQVIVVQGDAARETDVVQALAQIAQTMPPLRGIIHSAGTLDDAALLQQSWSRFETVFAPKVNGTWHLHNLTRGVPLDFFIIFSSIASLFGSPGQANHAAANMFMDVLAQMRRAQGLPALALNWGAWSQVGAAVEHGVGARIATQGIGVIAPEQGVQIVEDLLAQGATQVGVMPVAWQIFLKGLAPVPPFVSEMRDEDAPVDPRPTPRSQPSAAWLQRIKTALPAKQRNVVIEFVREQAGRVLNLDVAKIKERVPLSAMGLDSLMAVELRNRLSTGLELERKLPATLVFDYPTVEALADYLMRETLHLTIAAQEPEHTAAAQPGNLIESIEEMSDEEVERRLAAQAGRT